MCGRWREWRTVTSPKCAIWVPMVCILYLMYTVYTILYIHISLSERKRFMPVHMAEEAGHVAEQTS